MNNYYDNCTEILISNVSPPKTQPEVQLIETNIKSNRECLMSEEGYYVFSGIPCHLWKAKDSIGYGIHRLKAIVSGEKHTQTLPTTLQHLAELSKN